MLSKETLKVLKAADPDRYRAALFADKASRDDLHLLYAFHCELAKVPEIVSEPMIGHIRYQWWRECIEEIYSQGAKPVRKHEISTPLAALFLRHDVPRFWIDRLIDGRARDLDPEPFKSLKHAEEYCAQTSGVLMQIAVHICGGEGDERVLMAGQAWGLTGLARGWGYYADGALSELDYSDVCGAAQSRYDDAKSELGSIPAAVHPALSYAALVPKFLKRLTQNGHDPVKSSVSYLPVLKQLRLCSAVLKGRI